MNRDPGAERFVCGNTYQPCLSLYSVLHMPELEGSNPNLMTIDYFQMKYHWHNTTPEEKNMNETQYAMLTEVIGRWKADIIENFLRVEEIDVVLMQDAVSHSTQQTTFTPVKIFVPKASLTRARNLLKTFNEAEDGTKES